MSDALVNLAVERGARDNVTVICIQVSLGSTDGLFRESETDVEVSVHD